MEKKKSGAVTEAEITAAVTETTTAPAKKTAAKKTTKPAAEKAAKTTKTTKTTRRTSVAKTKAAKAAAADAAPAADEPVKPRVLFASFEAVPFAKTGGLGDVAGSLPAELNACGADVRLILPKFKTIPQQYKDQMVHVADFYVNLSWRQQYCGIERLEKDGVVVYFVDNEYYFLRDNAYGYDDDGERIAFFSKAILECLRYIDFFPQIIHCNDWHTALIPVLLRCHYHSAIGYDSIRTVFTVHNLKFQGIYPRYYSGDVLGISDGEAAWHGLIYNDCVNYMRGALCFSDRLTTVSPTYADEICTDFFGENMQEIFLSRRGVLSGILNGIDTKALDPETDPMLNVHYSVGDKAGKAAAKAALQREVGLVEDPSKPIFAIISRLTDQKGLDLVLHIIDEFMELDVQFVVLGVGQKLYEDKFRELSTRMPGKFAACLYFDEGLSHRIYSGTDFVLVPSLFEPCGLSQMMAMRYGSLPIVRETGGLKDSVIPYNQYTGEGNGFSFANYNAHELLFTMKDALDVYWNRKEAWDGLVDSAMKADFSWAASAKKYMALYQELL